MNANTVVVKFSPAKWMPSTVQEDCANYKKPTNWPAPNMDGLGWKSIAPVTPGHEFDSRLILRHNCIHYVNKYTSNWASVEKLIHV